jgi:hypothetical protein
MNRVSICQGMAYSMRVDKAVYWGSVPVWANYRVYNLKMNLPVGPVPPDSIWVNYILA